MMRSNHAPVELCKTKIPILTFLVWVAGGCSADATHDGVMRRDSAGVEIIEYSAAAIEAAPLYAVSDSFDLAIGVADGEAPYVFGRIGAAAELSDGTIAIFDSQAMEVRFFTGDGTFTRSAGRRGEGPREMQSTDGWWLTGGDTIRAWDDRLSGS